MNVEIFPDLPIIIRKQEETIKRLKQADVEDVRFSAKMPIDEIVRFGLDEGFLQEGLKSFPDPRQSFEIPIEILLLPQIIQRLNDEHSLVSAPYMLNSSDLITRLGYTAKIMEEGFNDRNKHPRETIFHGETLKHILLQSKPDLLIDWFNKSWSTLVKNNSPGRTRIYIMDGTKLVVPKHLVEKFQGAGVVKNDDGTVECGYKVVWIKELIDKKGVIRALQFAPINEHDIVIGRRLANEFDFEEGSTLIIDRGFLDGSWISHLFIDRKIHVTIPMRKNSEITQFAIAEAAVANKWEEHPSREEQKVFRLKKSDLDWKLCPHFESGVLVNFKNKQGEEEYVSFVSTKMALSPAQLLAEYDLRSEIEEDHRQLKCFQGLEQLPSKKYIQVIFRVIMGVVAYDLFNLFLNSEKCSSLEAYTLKLKRQRRREEKNPDVIIYTGNTYAIMKQWEFIDLLLSLPKKIQNVLRALFKEFARK